MLGFDFIGLIFINDMSLKKLSFQDTIESLPRLWPEDLLPLINQEIKRSEKKIFLMDDDPTGSQTVRNVAMLSDWSVESLEKELNSDELATFIQVNTRAYPENEVKNIIKEATSNILEATSRSSKDAVVIFRSDSTLRGHFPLEMDVFSDTVRSINNESYDALIFIPFFIQGRRYTFNDVQYTLDNNTLIPVGDTSFSNDPAFSYKSSNLKKWMEENIKGKLKLKMLFQLA